MVYQINLTWYQARDLALAGAMIRRIGWIDRWLYFRGSFWWVLPLVGKERVVQSYDFTAAEFLASDYTTTLPSQYLCFTPVPPEDPEPEPPEQPEAGGPVVQLYQFRVENSPKSSARVGERLIVNPIAGPAKVWLHGLADDRFRLKLNGVWVVASTNGSADWNYTATVDYRFLLGAGQSFSIAASNEGGGVCKYNVTGEFAP